MFTTQRARTAFPASPALRLITGMAAVFLSALGPQALAATDLAGTGPAPASFIAAGSDYDWNATLGQGIRLFAGGQWQPLSWFRVLGGARFTTRQSSPWVDAVSTTGWIFYPDSQFLEAVFQTPASLGLNLGPPLLNGGLRLQRMGVPGSTSGYLSLTPYNTIDLKWIYLRGGFAFRWWLDGQSNPAEQFELQALLHLGLRAFFGRDDLFLRLEANTGNEFESASLQAVGYELALVWPLAPHWQAQADVGLRPAGGFSLSATTYRVSVGCAVRVLP